MSALAYKRRHLLYSGMESRKLTQSRLKEAGVGIFFRPKDLEAAGISFAELQKFVEEGVVERMKRGLYRLTAAEPTEFETLAMVASAARDGIVCLLSALRLHEIGTQGPHEIWLAIDRKARKPIHLPAKVRIVRFSGAMLTYGVEVHQILGVPVKVTSPARTVVDCFRYRNKIGLDIALEALRETIKDGKVSRDEIMRVAEVCRARTVMMSYLETLTQ